MITTDATTALGLADATTGEVTTIAIPGNGLSLNRLTLRPRQRRRSAADPLRLPDQVVNIWRMRLGVLTPPGAADATTR